MNLRHVEVLLEELRQFQSDTKKKYSEIRDEASKFQNLLEKLKKNLRDNGERNDIKFPFDMFENFMKVVCNSKKAKLNINLMTIISRLFNLKLLHKYEEFYYILSYLDKIVDIKKQNLMIKLQQTLFNLITPQIISILKLEYMQLALIIMIKIRETCDIAMIKSLNFTIQSQIISVVSQQAVKYEQSQVQNNYMQIFRDFMDIIQKKIPPWFGNVIPSQDIGVECLSLMVDEGEKVFKGNCELENILSNELISILDTLLLQSQNPKDENLYIKILKLQTKIVGLIYSKYHIFQKFNLNDPKKFSKLRFSALEAYNSTFSKLESFQKFVEATYRQNNQNCQFVEFLKDLTEVAKDLFGNLTVFRKRRQKSYADSVGPDLDGNVELNGNDFLGITIQIINTITQNISAMCSSLSGVNLSQYKKFDKSYKFSYDEENFRSFFEDIYRHIYNIIKLIFSAMNNQSIPLDQQNAQLFVNIRNCIFLSLFLNKQKAFAQFFKLICQTILNKDSSIDQKFNFNTQIFYFIYDNFTECLNVSCWEYLIYYLHLCNHLIVREEERKESKSLSSNLVKTQQNTHQTSQTQQTEVHTIQNHTQGDDHETQINQFIEKLKNFFKNTQILSSKQLNCLIAALENSTYDMLEDHEALSKSSNPPRHHVRSESVSTPLIFSPASQQAASFNLMRRQYDETFTLTKMYEVVLSNKNRIHLIWKNISSILITISTCKEKEFRIKATTILGSILLEISQFFASGNQLNFNKELSSDLPKMSDSPLIKSPQLSEKEIEFQYSPIEIQGILFSVWETLSMCQFTEVKHIMSDQMEQMLHTLGTSLNAKGRQALLKVLFNFSEIQGNEKYIENFQCLIILLQSTNSIDINVSEIEQYMKALQGYINNSGDDQIIYHSCQQFLKLVQLLNELAKNQKSSYVMNTILNDCRDILFCLVQISTHSNCEIREQSLDCFATAIVEYSENFDIMFWTQIIYKDILFKISSDTIKYLYQYMQEQIKQKEENQDYVEWQNSSLQLIDSITEVTEKFVEFVSKRKQTDNLQTIQESPHETLSESQIGFDNIGGDVDSSTHLKKLSYEGEFMEKTNKNKKEGNTNSSEDDIDGATEKTSKTLLEYAPKLTNRTNEGGQQQVLSSKVIQLMNYKLSNNTISDKKVLHFQKRIRSAQDLENCKEKEHEGQDEYLHTENLETEGDRGFRLVSFEENIISDHKDFKSEQDTKDVRNFIRLSVEDEKVNSPADAASNGQKIKKNKLKIKDELIKHKKKKLAFTNTESYLNQNKLRQSQSMKTLENEEDDPKNEKEQTKNGYQLQSIDEMKESIEKTQSQQSPASDYKDNLIQLTKAGDIVESSSMIKSQEICSDAKKQECNGVETQINELIRSKQETAETNNTTNAQKDISSSLSQKNIAFLDNQSAASTKMESDSLSANLQISDAEATKSVLPQINIIQSHSQEIVNDDQKLRDFHNEDSDRELISLPNKEQKSVEINSLELYFIILGDFISFKITDITFLCVKDVSQFIKNHPQYIQHLQQEIITIVDRLDDFFSQIPADISESKKIIEYGIPETVNLLKQILSIDRIPKKKEHEQMIATSMALLYKIMIFPNMVEQTFNNVLYQVQYSEDIIYNLLNEIVTNFKSKRTLYKSIFICFIKEFFQEDVSDIFFDRTLKKILNIIKTLIQNEQKVNKKYIYDILLLIYRLINLKYDSTYHHFWYTSLNQQNNPVWYEATQTFTFIANILINNKIQVDPILQLTLDFFKQEIKEQDKIQFKSDEDLMLYLDHDKTLLLFLLKSFALGDIDLSLDQALEIGQLIHTFSQRKPNLQIEKIQLLEKFQTQSFSQFCLEALFQISNFIEGCSEQRLFNSQVFLPFFLSRAQAIFDKFISTIEQQNQKNNANTIKEVQSRQFLHFLENLQNLNIPPNTFKEFKSNKVYSALPYRLKKIDNPLLNSSKGHIGYLMPQLTECIHSNNLEVRELVKLIINTYHQKIGVYDLQ